MMSKKKNYRELMTGILRAHQAFHEVWTSVRTAELQKLTDRSDVSGDLPLELMWKANGVAYKTAESQEYRRSELLYMLYNELPFNEFGEGDVKAIDAMIDFLEIDIPAFHCGYMKEWILHRLKSMQVNPAQQQRLQSLTLAMCHSNGWRRELKHMARLMIHLADQQLIGELRTLAAQAQDVYLSKKAGMVLQIVLNGRPAQKP